MANNAFPFVGIRPPQYKIKGKCQREQDVLFGQVPSFVNVCKSCQRQQCQQERAPVGEMEGKGLVNSEERQEKGKALNPVNTPFAACQAIPHRIDKKDEGSLHVPQVFVRDSPFCPVFPDNLEDGRVRGVSPDVEQGGRRVGEDGYKQAGDHQQPARDVTSVARIGAICLSLPSRRAGRYVLFSYDIICFNRCSVKTKIVIISVSKERIDEKNALNANMGSMWSRKPPRRNLCHAVFTARLLLSQSATRIVQTFIHGNNFCKCFSHNKALWRSLFGSLALYDLKEAKRP